MLDEFAIPGFVAVVCLVSFTVSASAGLGGSLILVPALGLALGPRAGVATAALLLAMNNVAKLIAYRKTVSFRATAVVLPLTMIGAAVGAKLLVEAPETAVAFAVIVSLVSALVFEFVTTPRFRQGFGPLLALGSGALSGFSGTSGPLKGAALRTLNLDRLHFVGAAALVSFVNDAVKSAVYWRSSLVQFEWIAMALPLMALGTYLGRHFNFRIGERAFAFLFWAVMAGYVVRLAV
ncbi:MAG: sulfite exporter TauE/SafE family protein [Actinobacteria bacterium]|nr:sulfite exporter TauE/SafE family protein [Actinomycetota bacterium]